MLVAVRIAPDESNADDLAVVVDRVSGHERPIGAACGKKGIEIDRSAGFGRPSYNHSTGASGCRVTGRQRSGVDAARRRVASNGPKVFKEVNATRMSSASGILEA